MKNTFKHNYILATILLSCLLASADTLPMLNRYAFDARVWLTNYRNSVKLSTDAEQKYNEHNSLKIVNFNGKGTIYSGVHFEGKAPAEMQVRLNIKALSNGACNLRLNFNKKNGGNGSAGSIAFPIEYTKEWKEVCFYCSVPSNAISAQFVFSFSGKPTTIWFNDLYFGFSSDKVTIPKVAKANLAANLASAAWTPKQSATAFFQQDKHGKSDTKVQFAADAKGLYVAFINTGKAEKANFTKDKKDAPLWNDDCNELFLFNSREGKGRHFIVNANGSLYDAILFQKQDGDPWRDDSSWNAQGIQIIANQFADRWEARLFIPWKELGIKGKDGDNLGINLAREKKGTNAENIAWNTITGNWNVPANFGNLVISNGKMTITRARKAQKINYAVQRAKPQFAALLQKGVPGGYKVGAWSQGDHKQDLPATILAKIGDEGFYRWQNDLFNAWGVCGMSCSAFPWVQNYLQGGWEKINFLNQKYGMQFPYSMHSSYHNRISRERGAKYILPRDKNLVSPIDPVQRKFMVEYLRNFAKDSMYPKMKGKVSFIMGMDEPFNGYPEIFSPTLNPNKDAMKELDALLKQKYGFGKYGLPDNFANETPATPFQRIALIRWLNDEFYAANLEWQAVLKEIFPGVPFHMGTNNTCGGFAPMDYSLFNDIADILAVDPYPTSATYTFGLARGIYHTGFTTKMLNDLAPRPRTLVMPQCFIYCAGSPEPADIREWASQAMKNGADNLMWYCGDGAAFRLFDSYKEMLAVNRCIKNMDKLKLPTNCRSAVYFSLYDSAALKDNSLHAAYSLYGILGEKLRTNFHYIGATALQKGIRKLSDYRVVYIPKMTWSNPQLTASLVDYVKKGGRLVVLDPRFLSWNIDGTPIAERKLLTGIASIAPRKSVDEIIMNKQKYPLTICENIKLPTGYATECYALTVTPAAKVIATYPDGTPAAVSNKVGKGEVIYFGAQPFGNATLGITPKTWLGFFAKCAREAGEPQNQIIWDFTIPKEVLQYPELKPIQ